MVGRFVANCCSKLLLAFASAAAAVVVAVDVDADAYNCGTLQMETVEACPISP